MTDYLIRVTESGEVLDGEGRPSGNVVVPKVATKEWVRAYLDANKEYWRIQDAQALPPMKWRNGKPEEATAYGYEDAIAKTARPDIAALAVKGKACHDLRCHEEFRRGWNACLTELGIAP